MKLLRSLGRRRAVALAAAGLLVVSGYVWAAEPSFGAGCTVLGNFEIDGDMTAGTAGCVPTADDWNTINPQSTTQGGTYSASSKETNDPTGWTSSGSTPPKSDFATVYAQTRVVNGHFVTYVGWERDSGTGTGSYAIELDNKPARVNGTTPQPDRSGGGFVIYLDFNGSALPTFDKACSFGPTAYPPGTAYPGTCTTTPNGFAEALNTSPMTDPFTKIIWPAGQFFEAAIDFTALTGIVPSCPAPTAASLYLRSITGNTLENLKGYMDPFEVAPPSTCVPPKIETTATPGDGTIDGVKGVAAGSTQHDVVTVGTAQAPGIGTVKFFLCSPAEVTANGGDCHASGTLITPSPSTLDAGGSASSPSVSGGTDTAPGTYCWRAEFTPGANDHNYTAASHTNSDTECFTVLFAQPSMATQHTDSGSHPGALGLSAMGDTATLTGFLGDLTGQIVNFSLYGPYPDGVAPTCGQGPPVAPAFTTTGVLNAAGVATTSATFSPTQAGTYVWRASYGGDAINGSAIDDCNSANESEKIVGAVIDVAKSANPPGPVDAGDTIGFDITVTNEGSVPALDTTVTDNLPAGPNGGGGDLHWVLNPAYSGCAISGPDGSQKLTCNLGQVDGPGSLPVIHVQSATTSADCGTVDNVASVATSNGTGGDSDKASVVIHCANLSLTKTADDATVSAGQQIGFTVTLTNSGLGAANNVNLSDPLPAGSGVSWSIQSGPGNCTIQGSAPNQTLSCTGSLAGNSNWTVHVVSATTAASCKLYHNVASVTVGNAAAPQDATADTTVQCPDVTFTKTADDDTVSAGSQIGFTIKATNSSAQGTGSALGVTINDPLPSGTGVSWSIESGPGNCSIQGAAPNQTLVCTSFDLAPGASLTVHIVSDTTGGSCKTYSNTATLSGGNLGSSIPATDSTTVQCPNVTLTKTADDATVSAGEQIGFTITLSNSAALGTGTAVGVTISDPLPTGSGINWSIQSGPGNCSLSGAAPGVQTLTCSAVDLAPGGSETVHVVSATAFASCATYKNVASATGSNTGVIPEASAQTIVQCPTLTASKTADHATVSAGDPIGFTISVHNGGPGTAKAPAIDDALPAGAGVDWAIDPAYSGPGTCSITGAVGAQHLVCAFGDLVSGSGASVHVTSATEFLSCGAYANSATVTATNAPAVPVSATTTVQCPDPGISKTADADLVNAGQPIGFTITASNGTDPGTGVAKGVTIDDPLPAGSGINWSIASGPANCSIVGAAPTQTLQCTPADLAPGEQEVVHVTSATAFASCGKYDNTATLSLDNGPESVEVTADLIGTAQTFFAEATTAVQCPALSITKTADADAVNSGTQIGFTVTASNAGPGTALNAVVQDPLPAHPDVHWTIESTTAPAGACTISGADGSQVLTCELGDFPAEAQVTVHVVSATTANSCGDFDNTAQALAGNSPTVSASASTRVDCAEVAPFSPPPLAITGAGPINGEVAWAFGMILAGFALVLGGRRRRTAG